MFPEMAKFVSVDDDAIADPLVICEQKRDIVLLNMQEIFIQTQLYGTHGYKHKRLYTNIHMESKFRDY